MFILILILSGCGLREHIREKRAAKDNASCLAKGFTPNTDAFRLCLDNRVIERKADNASWDAFMANQKADAAKLGATTSCIMSSGTMVGSTCIK